MRKSDIARSYQLQANCYLTKPVQLDAFESLVKSINDFWLTNGQIATAGAKRMSKKVDQNGSASRRQPRRRALAARDAARGGSIQLPS